jgi:hypothetical protein
MSDDTRSSGRTKSAAMFEQRSQELRGYTDTIRQAILKLKS